MSPIESPTFYLLTLSLYTPDDPPDKVAYIAVSVTL